MVYIRQSTTETEILEAPQFLEVLDVGIGYSAVHCITVWVPIDNRSSRLALRALMRSLIVFVFVIPMAESIGWVTVQSFRLSSVS